MISCSGELRQDWDQLMAAASVTGKQSAFQIQIPGIHRKRERLTAWSARGACRVPGGSDERRLKVDTESVSVGCWLLCMKFKAFASGVG